MIRFNDYHYVTMMNDNGNISNVQLCKRESVDKMGGVVTTGMGGICLNWALCLRFVLTIAICLSI